MPHSNMVKADKGIICTASCMFILVTAMPARLGCIISRARDRVSGFCVTITSGPLAISAFMPCDIAFVDQLGSWIVNLIS